MADEEKEKPNSETGEEETEETTTEEETEETGQEESQGEESGQGESDETEEEGETVESLTEKNKQLFARAKRAEGFELKDGKWVKKANIAKKPDAAPSQNTLTPEDTVAFMNAKIHEDDVNEVIEWAKFKKISIKEALKSPILKATLAEKTEHRATAAAANVGKGRKGSTQATGEELLSKTRRTGELPGTDEGIEKLVEARRPSK